MDQPLGQASLAEAAIVRRQAETLVVAGDSNDALIVENFYHPKIVDDGIIVEVAASGRTDVMCCGTRASRSLVLPINNGRADAKRRSWEWRDLAEQTSDDKRERENRKDQQDSHDSEYA